MRERSHPRELLRQAADGRSRAGYDAAWYPAEAGGDGLVDLASDDSLGLRGDTRPAAAVEAARASRTESEFAAAVRALAAVRDDGQG
jgi:hypothetical protein